MIVYLLVGALLASCGVLLRPKVDPTARRTTGTVVDACSTYAFGEPAWRYTVRFTDTSGAERLFQPGTAGPRRPRPGARVVVSYVPSDPVGTARRVDGINAHIHWVILAVGLAIAGASLVVGLLV